MSVASKVTLGLAVCVSSAIIGYVHYKQSNDRYKLHEGVLRDVEQQQRRKNENRYTLQKQKDMEKQLKAAREKESNAEPGNPNETRTEPEHPDKRLSSVVVQTQL